MDPTGVMARPDGHAIDQHRASPALAFAAPEFGPCEAEIVAQHIQRGVVPRPPSGNAETHVNRGFSVTTGMNGEAPAVNPQSSPSAPSLRALEFHASLGLWVAPISAMIARIIFGDLSRYSDLSSGSHSMGCLSD